MPRPPTVPPGLAGPRLQPARSDHFRPDIEGLRGLAIVLVVAFHAVPGLLGGGYIGVDVFFVISGFLITGLLVRELRSRGRIDLRTFYVRRIRRLLPAATLAMGATFVLGALIVAPLDLPRVAGDGVASALSVANIRFAIASGDYFGAMEDPSPFLHYWSLSVEEQFYLVWPAFLIVAFLLARGPRGASVVVAAVALISFAAEMILTDQDVNWAFFSLPTRAWQLALGGLLAIAALGRRRVGVQGRSLGGGTFEGGTLGLIGWLGLGAVLLAGVLYDAELAYPGAWALVPTLGAVAIIVAGDRALGPGLILRTAPMRFLGRISYALYLWHWPLLVLPAIAIGEALPIGVTAGLVVLAVLVATASTVLVEEPIRRDVAPMSARRQLVVASSLVVAFILSVSSGIAAMTWVTEEAIAASRAAAVVTRAPPAETPEEPARSERTRRTSRSQPTDEPSPRPREKAPKVMTRRRQTEDRAVKAPPTTPEPQGPRTTPKPQRARRAPPVIRLPADVQPSLWDAPEDEEMLRHNGCLEAESATTPKECVFGNKRARSVIALVGDSHASHWFPALNRVAKRWGWRLVTFVKVSCPFTDIPVRNLRLKRTYWECARFNEATVAALQTIKPDLVVAALFRWQYPVRSADESAYAQGAGVARMLDRLPGRKVILADVPFPSHDVPSCLSKNLDDVRRCAVAAYRRTSGGSPDRERIAARRSGGSVVNLAGAICGRPGDCPVVRDGMIVYRDTHHLTATFSRSLASALERALRKVMRPAPGRSGRTGP